MLCETSQSQKDKYHVVLSHEVSKLASLRKRKLNVLIKSWEKGEMGTCSVGTEIQPCKTKTCIQYTFILIRRYILCYLLFTTVFKRTIHLGKRLYFTDDRGKAWRELQSQWQNEDGSSDLSLLLPSILGEMKTTQDSRLYIIG